MSIVVVSLLVASLTDFLNPIQKVRETATHIMSVPPPGKYTSQAGDVYDVTPFGPTPLSVENKTHGLCLQFWELKGSTGNRKADKVKDESGVVRLAGQTCSNRQFGGFDWFASYKSSNLRNIRLYPPGYPKDKSAVPFNIEYSGE